MYLIKSLPEIKFEDTVYSKDPYSAGGFQITMFNGNRQINRWETCKDYINDLVLGNFLKTEDKVNRGIHIYNSYLGIKCTSVSENLFYKYTRNSIRLINDYFAICGKKFNIKLVGRSYHNKQVFLVISIDSKIVCYWTLLNIVLQFLRCGSHYGTKEDVFEYLERISKGKTKLMNTNDVGYILGSIEGYKFLADVKIGNFFRNTLKETLEYVKTNRHRNFSIHGGFGMHSFTSQLKAYKGIPGKYTDLLKGNQKTK